MTCRPAADDRNCLDHKKMSFQYSKTDFPTDATCTEFGTDYCFSVTLTLPENKIRAMTDNPNGVTRLMLAKVQSGFVDTGNWGGAKVYRSPYAAVFWKNDHWEVGLIRGLTIMKSQPSLESGDITNQSWLVRVMSKPGTIESKAKWTELTSEYGFSTGSCPDGVAFPAYETGDSSFPPWELFDEGKAGVCPGQGYSDPIRNGSLNGVTYQMYQRVSEDVGKLIKAPGCPELQVSKICPQSTEDLPSCSSNLVSSGGYCVGRSKQCGADLSLKNCNGESVYTVLKASKTTPKAPCCRDDPRVGCLKGCDLKDVPEDLCEATFATFFIAIFTVATLMSLYLRRRN